MCLQFPDAWIGLGGSVECPSKSPDLSRLDFHLWGQLNSMMHQVKIRDIKHLKQGITNDITSISSTVLMRFHQQWETCNNMSFGIKGNHSAH